jgi:CDP-glycerol glycerophosphotransferase
MPVHNDQERLEASLDSLLAQTLERIEVILVDDGSTDHSPEIIVDYAHRDGRIKIITQRNGGSGSARNAGVAAARAPFITFVDSDDTIPAAAYAYMVNTLERTGSDFAVGAVRGVKRGKSSRPAWVSDVHRVKRLQITIEDFPDAMHDVIACNRVFRREFFDEKVGPFPTGIAFEDHAPMVTAYVRAKSFDLLSATTSNVRIREDAATLWQQKHQISNLRGRIAAKEMAWDVVSSEASPTVAAAWLGRILDFDLSLFVEFAIHADDAYREVVQAAARRFSDLADAAAWRHVRVDRKLRLALAAAGEWVQADRLIEQFRLNGAIPSTRVEGGRILADLDLADRLPVPTAMFELSKNQTSLAACIQKVAWQTNGQLRVQGFAFIQALDLTGTVPSLGAWLVNPATQERLKLDVQRFSSAFITRWSNHPNHSYDTAGFTLLIDPEPLADRPHASTQTPADPDEDRSSTRWQLVLQAEARGVTRRGSVHSLVRSGVAMRMRAGELNDPRQPFRVVPMMDDRLGFVIQIRRERLRAVSLESRGAHQLAGTLQVLRPLTAPLSKVIARQNGRTVAKSPLTDHSDGTVGFNLSLPIKGRPEHRDVRVLDAAGRLHRVAWPTEQDIGHEIGPYGPQTARWRRSPRGFVQLSSQPVLLRAHHVEVTEDFITVDLSLDGRRPGALRSATLRSALVDVSAASVEPGPAGRHRVAFPAKAGLWGSTVERPLPSGTYTVVVPHKSDKVLTCAVSADLMEELPNEFRTATHGVTLARRPGSDKLTIDLRAPLAEDERGHGAQHRLAQWYADTDFAPSDQVFFQCYRGEFATDSQRAIHEELFRRGTPLELVWGVHDLSVDLPVGARPVLMGSRAWYEAIARARYLCNNNDFDRFFVRRPHQRFLQTFHGYPFKSMGLSFWRARELSAELIDYECRRRTDAWTSILVPASFCEEIYRQEYLYDGEVLVTGYPRNDVLVTTDSSARTEILHRLGVPPDKTVVLYAPTWRDTIATGDWSAKYFDALDLNALADALGDDHVLLLRGHNFNMREGVLKASHATIVDVTRYPEITDLILAADVAVLDYSSLRFDWVLTGKPVLFFVPDLADYLSARTALFEYGPTAPGPLLHTTDDVIEAIWNLDSVSRDFAQARTEFNERFNGLHDGRATRRVVDAFFGPGVGR